MINAKKIAALRHARQYGIGRLLLLARKDFVSRLQDKLAANGRDLPASGGTLLPFIDLEGIRGVELARRMGITKQAVAKALKELEDAGLVSRTADEADGRAYRVAFTTEGLNYLLEIHDAIAEVEQEYSAIVGVKQMTQMREVLSLIVYPKTSS